MSGNNVSTHLDLPHRGVGIDYDMLAAAMLRVGGGGGLARVFEGRVGEVAAGAVGGEVGGAVGVASSLGGGEAEAVAGELRGAERVAFGVDGGFSLPPGFGAIPSSEDGVVVEDGASVRSESSGASVSGGAPGRVSSSVRDRVSFGGMSDVYEEAVSVALPKPQGYFAMTAKRSLAVALKKHLLTLTGVKLPRQAMVELGICTYTAGTMPTVVADGVKRLRSLAAIGDAVITFHLTLSAYRSGVPVSSAQNFRSTYASNVHFRNVMKSKGLLDYVTFASGVNPEVTGATATAFEAIVGVVSLYRDANDVARFLRVVGVVV